MREKNKPGLAPQKDGQALLDMYYLEARSHLLETAAILDRIERAGNDSCEESELPGDRRVTNLFRICELLLQAKGNRAEQILKMLSVS